MVELKILEKVRKVLLADTTIKECVQDRIYTAHISTIKDPIYPAISLTLLTGQSRTNVPDMVNMAFQCDLWFPSAEYTVDEVGVYYARVRALLHKQALSDTVIGVKIMQIFESGIGPMMFDQGIPGHHLPARYAAVGI